MTWKTLIHNVCYFRQNFIDSRHFVNMHPYCLGRMVAQLSPRTQSGLSTRLAQQQSRFNLCPGRKALNKTISRFLLSMAILLMSGVDFPFESNRTIAHLRGQRGPPRSVAPPTNNEAAVQGGKHYMKTITHLVV